MTPALECQGQENRYKLEASLVNTVRSSPMTELHSDTLSTNKQNKTKQNRIKPNGKCKPQAYSWFISTERYFDNFCWCQHSQRNKALLQPWPCLFIQAERTMKSALGDKNLSAKTNL